MYGVLRRASENENTIKKDTFLSCPQAMSNIIFFNIEFVENEILNEESH